MLPCAEPYLESLRNCNIEINNNRRSDCIWVSSVRGDAELLRGNLSELKDQYWVDNMCKPVLFSYEVEASIWNGGPVDVALELGPHPALKGPVESTFKASFGSAPAYAGLLRRGDSAVEAISGALGYVWSHLGSGFIDLMDIPEHLNEVVSQKCYMTCLVMAGTIIDCTGDSPEFRVITAYEKTPPTSC